MTCKRCGKDKEQSDFIKRNSTICKSCKEKRPNAEEHRKLKERLYNTIGKNEDMLDILKKFVDAYIEKDKKKLYVCAERARDYVHYEARTTRNYGGARE